jgi:hypothetical protein
LALAMAAGLAFATITTLYVIPALYMIYQEEERIKRKLKTTLGGFLTHLPIKNLFSGILERLKIARS